MSLYRIVLADDHHLFREAVRRSIEKIPELQVVGEAGDGLELLKVLENLSPDLVIVDISMPNLRGIEATREIKRLHPRMKILMLTMHKSQEHLASALACGADGYLLKEDAFGDLLTAIETIRQGKTFVTPLLMGEMAEVMRDLSLGKTPGEPLTVREIEVIKLVAEGKSSKEIAELLYISIPTVRTHRHNIKRKLKVKKSADLVKYAIRKGFASEEP